MQKRKKMQLVVVISILFVSGLTFANAFRSIGVSVVSGQEADREKAEVESEEKKGEVEKVEEEKDEKRSIEDEKNDKLKDNEEKKVEKNVEYEARTNKIKSKTSVIGQKADNDEDEAGEVDEADSESGDLQEEIQDLKKDIKKVESKISVLSANGISTASLASSLEDVRSLVAQAESKIATSVLGVDALLEAADNKLGRLQRLVKMTLGDEDEADDDETGKDATEKIQEVTKEAGRLEIKLNAIAEAGKDVSSLKIALNIAKDLLSQAKEKLTAGDFVTSESLAEMAEKKIESVKHSMELAYGDDEEDGDKANEYKNEVAKFVHNLEDISQMDGGIGQQVKVVAQAQNASVAKVESSIKNINDRSGFVKFLVGPKYGSIAEVKTIITENQSRIKVLSDLINQVTDPVVKQVLQEQVGQFQQENTRLQALMVENEKGVSLFGWLTKLFA